MPAKRAERFLRTSGVFIPSSSDSFWARVESSLGPGYAEELNDALERRAAGDRDAEGLYELLNRSSDTALLTASLVAPLLQTWLQFVERCTLPPGDVLDLGCGSGIATSFYAVLRPHDEVVGVDSSEAAIRAASDLARRLRVPNVRFEVAEVNPGWSIDTPFSVLISSTLLREIEPEFGAEFMFGFSTMVEIHRALESGRSTLAEAAARAATDDAVYLSLERLTGPTDVAAWMGSLQRAGFGPDLASSEYLSALSLLSGDEYLPAVVATAGAESVSSSGVVDWLLEEEHIASSELGDEAELKRYAPITLATGWQADVQDQWGKGSTRLAILRDHQGRHILYLTTSRGFRQIIGIDDTDPASLMVHAESMLTRFDADPSVQAIRSLAPSDAGDF